MPSRADRRIPGRTPRTIANAPSTAAGTSTSGTRRSVWLSGYVVRSRPPTETSVAVSGASPFAGCTADAVASQTGTNYPSTEVEPWISVNPIEFAVSGEDENSPTSAKIHENA